MQPNKLAQWVPCSDETVRDQVERLKQDEPKVHAFWSMVAREINELNAAHGDIPEPSDDLAPVPNLEQFLVSRREDAQHDER